MTLVVAQVDTPADVAVVVLVVAVVAAAVHGIEQVLVSFRRCAGRATAGKTAGEREVVPILCFLIPMGLLSHENPLSCTRTILAGVEQLRHSQLGVAVVFDSSQAAEEVDVSMVEEEDRCFPAWEKAADTVEAAAVVVGEVVAHWFATGMAEGAGKDGKAASAALAATENSDYSHLPDCYLSSQ